MEMPVRKKTVKATPGTAKSAASRCEHQVTGSSKKPNLQLLKTSEVKSLVEEIMKRVLIENRIEEKLDLQSLCKIIVQDQLDEFRQEMRTIESNLSSRIKAVEEYSETISKNIDDLRENVLRKGCTNLRTSEDLDDIDDNEQDVYRLLEAHRRKLDQSFEKLRGDFHVMSADIDAKMSSISGEVKACAAEIVEVNDALTAT